MIKSLECPHCGQMNDVDLHKIDEALCEFCKGEFSSLVALGGYKSTHELVKALEIDTEFPQTDKIDVSTWTSKIGSDAKKEEYVKEGFLKKIKKHAAKIPFAKDAVTMYFCAIDSNTPLSARIIAMGALAYILLPFDAIPDVILALGYTDDAAAFWAAYKIISVHVTDVHRQKAKEWFVK